MSEAKYRLGLVLEGGAVRGIYTAGVLDVLMKHGVQADMVIGTSAGASTAAAMCPARPGAASATTANTAKTGILWAFTRC